MTYLRAAVRYTGPQGPCTRSAAQIAFACDALRRFGDQSAAQVSRVSSAMLTHP